MAWGHSSHHEGSVSMLAATAMYRLSAPLKLAKRYMIIGEVSFQSVKMIINRHSTRVKQTVSIGHTILNNVETCGQLLDCAVISVVAQPQIPQHN